MESRLIKFVSMMLVMKLCTKWRYKPADKWPLITLAAPQPHYSQISTFKFQNPSQSRKFHPMNHPHSNGLNQKIIKKPQTVTALSSQEPEPRIHQLPSPSNQKAKLSAIGFEVCSRKEGSWAPFGNKNSNSSAKITYQWLLQLLKNTNLLNLQVTFKPNLGISLLWQEK